jgi:DNA-binding CsgD family transcriptional regulator
MVHPDLGLPRRQHLLAKATSPRCGEPDVLAELIGVLAAVYGSGERGRRSRFPTATPADHGEAPTHEPALLARSIAASQTLAARALLDHLPYGLIATDHVGRVLFVSESARRVLEAGTILTSVDGAVHAVSPDDDGRLRAALARVCVVAGPATSPAELLTMGSGTEPVTVFVTPMRNGRDRRLAAVLLPDSHRAAAACRLLGHLFGLTRSESELLKLTLAGRSVSEAAVELNLRARTACERWRDVCWKLRTRNESECLRLLHLALLLPVDDFAEQVQTAQRVSMVQEVPQVP